MLPLTYHRYYPKEADYYFLKTVISNRKATRDYLLRSNPDEKT